MLSSICSHRLETATAGGVVRVDLVILNPTSVEIIFETPLVLDGKLSSEQHVWPIELRETWRAAGRKSRPAAFPTALCEFTVPSDLLVGGCYWKLDRPQPARER